MSARHYNFKIASILVLMLHSKPEEVFSYHAPTVVANLKAKYGIE